MMRTVTASNDSSVLTRLGAQVEDLDIVHMIAVAGGFLLVKLQAESLVHAVGDERPNTGQVLGAPRILQAEKSDADALEKSRFVECRVPPRRAWIMLAC